MGYEHNINYKEKIFSIITTDLGNSLALIKTSIFIEGRVLVSIERSYKALLNNPLKDILLEKIKKNQHKDVMRKLIDSSYDGLIRKIIINKGNKGNIADRLKNYNANRLREERLASIKNLNKESKGIKGINKSKEIKESKENKESKKNMEFNEKPKDNSLDNLILNFFKD